MHEILRRSSGTRDSPQHLKIRPSQKSSTGTAALDCAIRWAFQDEALKEEQHQCKGIATKARASAAWTELNSSSPESPTPRVPRQKDVPVLQVPKAKLGQPSRRTLKLSKWLPARFRRSSKNETNSLKSSRNSGMTSLLEKNGQRSGSACICPLATWRSIAKLGTPLLANF